MDDVIAHDFNGDFYVVGSSGEEEEQIDYQRVYIFEGDAASFAINRTFVASTAAHTDLLQRTVRLNYWHLRALPEAERPLDEACWKIAYLRVLGLTKGLGDPALNIGAHNVRYSDITIVPDDLALETYTPANVLIAAHVDNARAAIANYNAVGNQEWRRVIKKKMTNAICLLAFFMRTRGHHWTEDMEARYTAIWRRCLYNEDSPGLDWRYVTRHAFHFIYPDTLDTFWSNAIDDAHCNGALVKRWNSFAAGTAAVGACLSGANDISTVFPKIRDVIPQAFAELDRCVTAINTDRWVGSINRRFYGGGDLTINERALGALAAVILAALDQFQSNAKLRESAALKRVAENAPITGAIIATTLQKAAADDRMVNAILLEEEDED